MSTAFFTRNFALTTVTEPIDRFQVRKMVPVTAAQHDPHGRRKARILCLHGKGTNGSVFASQTSAIRHKLRDECDFVFVDGLHMCDPYPGTDRFYNVPFYSWYENDSIESLLEAEAAVRDLLVQLGPFDGIMGFSQGGALAAFLCARDRVFASEKRSGLTFAILMCCGVPAGLAHMDLHETMTPDMIRLLRRSSEQGERRALVTSLDDVSDDSGSSSPELSAPWHALSVLKRTRSSDEILLGIPSAHIMGQHDSMLARSNELFNLCNPMTRHRYEHTAGHSLPRISAATTGIADALLATVRTASQHSFVPSYTLKWAHMDRTPLSGLNAQS